MQDRSMTTSYSFAYQILRYTFEFIIVIVFILFNRLKLMINYKILEYKNDIITFHFMMIEK